MMLHPGLPVVDERPEDGLGLAEVLGHRAGRITAHERADRRAAEKGRGVDARVDVIVDSGTSVGVGVEVVVVVGQRRALQAVPGEASVSPRLGGPESVDHEVGGRERRSPRSGHAATSNVEVVLARPPADLGQRALRQARGQETQLHVAPPSVLGSPGTSSHRWVGAERTASVTHGTGAVGESGQPVHDVARARLDGAVGVGHERVEAVLVPWG